MKATTIKSSAPTPQVIHAAPSQVPHCQQAPAVKYFATLINSINFLHGNGQSTAALITPSEKDKTAKAEILQRKRNWQNDMKQPLSSYTYPMKETTVKYFAKLINSIDPLHGNGQSTAATTAAPIVTIITATIAAPITTIITATTAAPIATIITR